MFSSVLERNLSTEFIRDFKQSLLAPLEHFSTVLSRVTPKMSDQDMQEFLFQHHAMIAGLWPLAHPSPEVSRVLQDEEFKIFQTDFYRLFQTTMRQLLEART